PAAPIQDWADDSTILMPPRRGAHAATPAASEALPAPAALPTPAAPAGPDLPEASVLAPAAPSGTEAAPVVPDGPVDESTQFVPPPKVQ
ncbi:MAG: hypothetical protein LBR19_02805, partial [Bifidobacteriaceae bacterium]|nr:hypothetical protein [Bifidobacteriaceae bacterium]